MASSEIKNRVLDLLEGVANPQGQRGLFAEKRVLDVQADNNACHITLDDQGLEGEVFTAIKEQVVQKLCDLYPREAITVAGPAGASAPQPEAPRGKADLRVGHEGVTKKRSLPMVKNIVAIASGKGGVGKSTFTANLALALKGLGLTVGVVDSDIYGPSLPMIFGQRGQRPLANEHKQITPIIAFGIPIMSFGFFVAEKDPVIWRGPMLGGVINQFLFDVAWPQLDYLLIDLPPGTGDIQLSLAQMVQLTGAIIISTPQDIALIDAKKGLKMLQKLQVPILGLVQNMSYFVGDDGKKYYLFGKNGVVIEANALDIALLGEIPLEIALREGSDQGVPYMSNQSYRNRQAWQELVSIARKLSYAVSGDEQREGEGSAGVNANEQSRGFLRRLWGK